MAELINQVEKWIAEAQGKLANGGLKGDDLAALEQAVRGAKPRQRLLYLHASTPFIGSAVIAATLHEPVAGGCMSLDPLRKDPEYKSVHDAIVDGWQVIQFPNYDAPFDDREVDMLGYQFILQKVEYVHEQ